MFASFQSSGIQPNISDLLNNSVSQGAITSADSFKIFAGNSSDPVALLPSIELELELVQLQILRELHQSRTGLSLVTDYSPFQRLKFPDQTRIPAQNTGCGVNNSATSLGVEALTLELSLVAMVIVSGTFLCIDFTFKTDQKRFGFDFKFDSISTKNASLHPRSLRLILERRDLNFSLRTPDALCFSFLRTESFLLMRFTMEPLIQESGFVPLSFFFGIKSAIAARTASFQQRQSLLMSAASCEIKFDKFAARREERNPLKSPLL